MKKTLKKIWNWLDDRGGLSSMVSPLTKHPVPPDAKWMYVFGSATLFCLILQIVTGVALSLLYQPTSESAYESLKYITEEIPLGGFLRGLHYFGASGMILLVGIHMIRVYLTAAYKYPREVSWMTGIFLLLLTLGMGFTGQLLRWDSNGVWSAMVGAQQAGRIPFIGKWLAHFLLAGETIGGSTLSRFFAIHVFLVPAVLFAFLGWHIYLVIINGISEPPKAGRTVNRKSYRQWYDNMLKEKGVPFWPNAAWRDMLFGLVIIFVIAGLAWFKGPPEIGSPPDPTNIQSNPRPDWYFMWIFAMFALMPPRIEEYVIAFGPMLIILFLVIMPLIFNQGERSPVRRPWSIAVVVVVIIMVASFWAAGIKSPWSPEFNAKPIPAGFISKLSPKAQEGADLFRSKSCMACHHAVGSGGLRGPDLTHVASRMTPEQMTIRIVNGATNMPPYGGSLTKTEMNKIITFLEEMDKKKE